MIMRPRTRGGIDKMLSKVVKAKETAIIYFGGEHCQPCQALKPRFQAFAKEHPKGNFIEIDTETKFGGEFADEADVDTTPIILFWRDDKVIDEIDGYDEDKGFAPVKKKLTSWIKRSK